MLRASTSFEHCGCRPPRGWRYEGHAPRCSFPAPKPRHPDFVIDRDPRRHRRRPGPRGAGAASGPRRDLHARARLVRIGAGLPRAGVGRRDTRGNTLHLRYGGIPGEGRTPALRSHRALHRRFLHGGLRCCRRRHVLVCCRASATRARYPGTMPQRRSARSRRCAGTAASP